MKLRPLFIIAFLAEISLGLTPQPGQAEPHIVIGPSETDEAPEVVETISGLSYDQLQRLRALREWLDQRQFIREQIQLQNDEIQRLGIPQQVFAERQLFAPLGQRYVETLPRPSRLTPEQLQLPPLPRFERVPAMSATGEEPTSDLMEPAPSGSEEASTRPGRVTHITPPPRPGAAESQPQIEYELNPDD